MQSNKKKSWICAVKAYVGISFMFAFIGGVSVACFAQSSAKEEKKIKRTVATKAVQGEVTWIGKNKIAVMFAQDEHSQSEMLLPFSEDIKFEHAGSARDIFAGDTVHVSYEETFEEGPEGKKEWRKAKVISLLRPGPRLGKPPSVQEREDILLGE